VALIISDHTKRWPGGCVVWQFHEAMSEAERAVLRNAMDDWHASDRDVRFLERTTQTSFVVFTPDGDVDDRNRSEIGMQGGLQRLWLEPITPSDNRQRSARHEIGHTLGFHHEHVRCDRDANVKIDMSKIPLQRYGDYYKQCGNGFEIVGAYDFRSIMHYRPRKSKTTDGSVDITAVDQDDDAALKERKRITVTDIAAVAELHGGNAHIYQLSAAGQLEKTVEQYKWSSGWNTATPFSMGLSNYLFLLKSSNGRAVVLPVNFDGSFGDAIDKHNWTSGWTSATKYAIGPFNYLYIYKRGDGTRHINRINGNGTIGPQAVASTAIEGGWTSIRQYSIGLNNFLIYANSKSGTLRVRSIDWDGTEGTPLQTREERTGWTSVEPYAAEGKNYLLMLNGANGDFRTRRIRDDGTTGPVEDRGNLGGGGWLTAMPYEVGGTSYVLLCNWDTGNVRIRRLGTDGGLGTTTDRRSFGPGWGIARKYQVGFGTYMVLVKT
jgi:Astacin (Peptidase family M12A)